MAEDWRTRLIAEAGRTARHGLRTWADAVRLYLLLAVSSASLVAVVWITHQ